MIVSTTLNFDMVLEERCYWELGPTINGFFKSVTDSCPPVNGIVV